MNAVQGAYLSGAAHVIAVDPVADKRKWALGFGATEGFESIPAAMDRVRELTNGQGADVCILTAGLVHNDLIGQGYQAIRKSASRARCTARSRRARPCRCCWTCTGPASSSSMS
jgi:Zn-dependent alcohol dehydrogenase